MLERLIQRGRYVPDCVAAFPSVTPVCAASIVTGVAQDEHLIPAMNWFHREEDRYVEYGSSFRAAQRFGIARQLTDTVYNMNRAHLASDTPTVFEALDDADVRTAGTTYLMYRGRHRHEPQRDTRPDAHRRGADAPPRARARASCSTPTSSPRRRTGCRSGLGMPGVRDRHSGVRVRLPGASTTCSTSCCCRCPTTTGTRTSAGPRASCTRSPRPTCQLARVMNAAGGVERVPRRARHDRRWPTTPRRPSTAEIALQDELAELGVLGPARQSGAVRGEEPRIAVCPSQRAAMVYALQRVRARRDARLGGRRARSRSTGVDLVMWLERDAHDAPREAVIASPARGELRFAPGGAARDPRGRRWSVEGELEVLDGERRGRACCSRPTTRTRSARVWSALTCPTSGRGAAVGRRRRTSSSTGAARRTSAAAATARCTPATRSARCILSGVDAARAASPRSGRSATSRRSCSSTSALGPTESPLASARCEHAPAARQRSLRRARAGRCPPAPGRALARTLQPPSRQAPTARSRRPTRAAARAHARRRRRRALAIASASGEASALPVARARYRGSYGGGLPEGPVALAGQLLLARRQEGDRRR